MKTSLQLAKSAACTIVCVVAALQAPQSRAAEPPSAKAVRWSHYTDHATAELSWPRRQVRRVSRGDIGYDPDVPSDARAGSIVERGIDAHQTARQVASQVHDRQLRGADPGRGPNRAGGWGRWGWLGQPWGGGSPGRLLWREILK